jgi:ER degradation enhancer, mannosidase alpha-like 2
MPLSRGRSDCKHAGALAEPESSSFMRIVSRVAILAVAVATLAEPGAPQDAMAPFPAQPALEMSANARINFSTAAISASVTHATEAERAAQDSRADTNADSKQTADRIRQEFLFAWNAYKQYAWGHDDLRPLSKSYKDWYGVSLYMTPVDALDTMILMGLKPQADEDRELIATKLSFDQDISVKNFEITIRLLGGLLSSYELTGDKRLFALAQDLGNRLLPAFNSPTGMPYVFVNLKTGAVRDPNTNPAEVGTLLIEFGTLSKLTHNPVYYDKAKRAMVEIYNRRSKIGLVGSEINIETGAWIDPSSNVSGGIDSYYEYLLKSWLLFGDKDCKRMWDSSLKALNTHVADERATGLWYGTVDMNTGKRLATHWGALDAFFAGTLMLAGDRSRAMELEDSSFRMWNIAGIEPEEIDYSTLTITAPGYPLRPEIIESAYYLHYFTKDPQYLDMGHTFLDGLVKYCKTDAGYAALRDVQTKEKEDDMESFFLAETLKYLYLIFAPHDTVDLKNTVFNTEAHPIHRIR